MTFYERLPSKKGGDDDRDSSKASSDPKFTQTFVASLLSSSGASAGTFESKVQAKTLLLDNPPIDPELKAARKTKKVQKRRRNRTKALSVKEKKALGLHLIPPESIR